MGKPDLTKKRQERIQRRQYLTDRFLTHFVFAVLFSVYVVGTQMSLAASHRALAAGIRFWTFVDALAIALVIAFLPMVWKRMRTDWWWRTGIYFFAFLGGLHGLIMLLYKIFMMFGNMQDHTAQWAAWSWSHAIIWVGFLVCGGVYFIENRKIGKN